MQTEEAAARSAHFHPCDSSQPQTGQQPGRAADAGSRPTHRDSNQCPHSRPPHVDRGCRCHVGAFPLVFHPSSADASDPLPCHAPAPYPVVLGAKASQARPDIAEASAKCGWPDALGTGSVLPLRGGVVTASPLSGGACPSWDAAAVSLRHSRAGVAMELWPLRPSTRFSPLATPVPAAGHTRLQMATPGLCGRCHSAGRLDLLSALWALGDEVSVSTTCPASCADGVSQPNR